MNDQVKLGPDPRGWKSSYWPEPRLGKPRANGFWQKPRTAGRELRAGRWEKLALQD